MERWFDVDPMLENIVFKFIRCIFSSIISTRVPICDCASFSIHR
jgi:hypothetical protein